MCENVWLNLLLKPTAMVTNRIFFSPAASRPQSYLDEYLKSSKQSLKEVLLYVPIGIYMKVTFAPTVEKKSGSLLNLFTDEFCYAFTNGCQTAVK